MSHSRPLCSEVSSVKWRTSVLSSLPLVEEKNGYRFGLGGDPPRRGLVFSLSFFFSSACSLLALWLRCEEEEEEAWRWKERENFSRVLSPLPRATTSSSIDVFDFSGDKGHDTIDFSSRTRWIDGEARQEEEEETSRP